MSANNQNDIFRQKFCPVTNLPIQSYIVDFNFKDTFKVSLALVGENNILSRKSGFSTTECVNVTFEKINELIKNKIHPYKQCILIEDYSRFDGSTIKARRAYIRQAMKQKRVKAVVFYGASSVVKMSINLGRLVNPSDIKVYVENDYEDAILKANSINDLEYSNSSFIPPTKDWELKLTDFSSSFKLLDYNIIYNECVGLLRRGYSKQLFDFLGRVIEESNLSGKKYYRIVNVEKMENFNMRTRTEYLAGTKQLNKNFPCSAATIYGLDKYMKFLVKTGSALMPYPLKITKNYEEALSVIREIKYKKKSFVFSNLINKRYGRKELEGSMNELLSYIASISWDSENIVEKQMKGPHVFEKIYDALNILKDDFKYLVEEKANMQKKVFHASKLASIGELAAGVGHEINNPLAIIQGNLELMREEIKDENLVASSLEKYLSKQESSIKRISKIVDGLRTYARADVEHTETIDVHKLIRGSISLIEIIYKQEFINIELSLGAKEKYIMGNIGKLQQVIMNLLSNARDALRDKNGGTIKIETIQMKENIEIRLSDNGSGIAKENLKKMFDAFFTTKPIGRGTGLGLSISNELVEKMGGTIKVDSKEGEGTTFILSFPLVKEK